MARITVEDCLKYIPNRFDLTIVAARRAKELATGVKDAMVPWNNDKPTLVALREIAAGHLDAILASRKKSQAPAYDFEKAAADISSVMAEAEKSGE